MGTMKTVLVVDDDVDIRNTLVEILKYHNYQVLFASNGQHALEILDGGNRPNTILLDLMMPVMNGWKFLEVFRARPDLKGIEIVVLTAFNISQTIDSVKEVLRKPVDLDTLLSVIEKPTA